MTKNQVSITSLQDLQECIRNQDALLVYFSTPDCQVCKVLKPKVQELLETQFPEVCFCYADTESTPDAAAQYSVFTVPTLIGFFDSREVFRKSRNLGIAELEDALRRPYTYLFSNDP